LARFLGMAFAGLAMALAGAALGPVSAADRDQSATAEFTAGKTGKERLSGKAADEQRVDDCKVPPARRTRIRPTDCPRS
jgi:hypothetical protein